MSKPVLGVYGVSKSFHINRVQSKAGVSGGSAGTGTKDVFYALNDISFELNRGDVLGIIGGNGSGKSTLLKILSGITRPSAGRVEINAELTSILEIGTGFLPDLTGRENVLMSSTLLGINRKDMLAAMEDIIAFSGIGEFIDTSVKHYSSGMYLRLATSLVFQLNAGILVFDEILSVGDAEFRMKVFAKMEELVAKGTTIVMVSHNMNEVLQLCSKCIILEHGHIKSIGEPAEKINEYLEQSLKGTEALQHHQFADIEGANYTWSTSDNAPGNELIKIKGVAIKAKDKSPNEKIYAHDTIQIDIDYWKLSNEISVEAFLVFFDHSRTPVFTSNILWNKNEVKAYGLYKNQTGVFKITCHVPGDFLKAGVYSFDMTFGKDTATRVETIYRHAGHFYFSVYENPVGSSGFSLDNTPTPIAVRPHFYWWHTKVD